MKNPPIRWWRVDLGDEEVSAVTGALRARRVTMGPLASELEQRLAHYLQVPCCALVNSGASALVAALFACGVGPGDDVVIPGLTFIATANAAWMLGARLRCVDVRPDRPVMDTSALPDRLGPRTRVIVPVHLGGRAVNLDALHEVARARGARVVEDAAQALGSRDRYGFLGTRSDVGCFSFGITKLVTTGEGGAVVTSDPEMDRRIRRVRNNGAVSLMDNRFEGPGLNLRPLDLLAAMGLAGLDQVERRTSRLRKVYRRYREGLMGLRSVRLIPVDEDVGEVPLWVEVLAADRDAAIRGLARHGIEAKPYPPALGDVRGLGLDGTDLPRSRYFAAHGLILPSGPDRTDEEVDRVLEVLADLDRSAGREVPEAPGPGGSGGGPGSRLDNPSRFRRDDSGRSPAFFALDRVPTVDAALLDEIEQVAMQEGGVARICLHPDPRERVQDMIIAKTRDAPVRPGRCLRYPRTFHAIRGKLAIILFEEDGAVRESHLLGPEHPILLIREGSCYVDFPWEGIAVYREVLMGPRDPDAWIGSEWWPADEAGQSDRVLEWRGLLRPRGRGSG